VAFDQRLPAAFYADVQDGVRAALAAERVDALLTDSPEDVAYLTGFFHHPCERPVAVWIGVDGTTALLLPDLEVEHAQVQNTAAELVVYPEYPGVVPRFPAPSSSGPASPNAPACANGPRRQRCTGRPGGSPTRCSPRGGN